MLQQNSAAATFSAARQMYLPDVAEALGFKLKRGQQKFYGNHCPNCGEGRPGGNALSVFEDDRGVWRWNCFCCGKGGTSIDFVVHAKGLSDREAAKYLVNERIAPVVPTKVMEASAKIVQATSKALAESIDIISRRGLADESRVQAYLKERRISAKVQAEAYRRGMLRMLPSDPKTCVQWLCDEVGESRLRAAGLWRSGAKWPAIAFRPLVSIFPLGGSIEFRIAREQSSEDEPKAIRYGGMKWPWWWKGNSNKPPRKIMVVEGSIDLWSVVEMGGSDEVHIMGIPGTGTWNAAWMKLAAERNNCSDGLVGVDRDPAGDSVAQTMLQEIRASGLNSDRCLPETKDWNRDLANGRKSIF